MAGFEPTGFHKAAYQSTRGVPTKLPVDNRFKSHGFAPRRRSGFADDGDATFHRRWAMIEGYAAVIEADAGAPILAGHHVEGLAEDLTEFEHCRVVPTKLIL